DDEPNHDQGSAYVYRFNGTNYVYEMKLTASDGAAEDNFASSVSTTGSIILVGAHAVDGPGGIDQGAAYVFKYNGAGWTQTHNLTAGNGAASDFFGTAVAISGGTALVGALGVDFPGLPDIGSAYVFTCAGCPVIAVGPTTALPQGRVGALYSQKFTAI